MPINLQTQHDELRMRKWKQLTVVALIGVTILSMLFIITSDYDFSLSFSASSKEMIPVHIRQFDASAVPSRGGKFFAESAAVGEIDVAVYKGEEGMAMPDELMPTTPPPTRSVKLDQDLAEIMSDADDNILSDDSTVQDSERDNMEYRTYRTIEFESPEVEDGYVVIKGDTARVISTPTPATQTTVPITAGTTGTPEPTSTTSTAPTTPAAPTTTPEVTTDSAPVTSSEPVSPNEIKPEEFSSDVSTAPTPPTEPATEAPLTLEVTSSSTSEVPQNTTTTVEAQSEPTVEAQSEPTPTTETPETYEETIVPDETQEEEDDEEVGYTFEPTEDEIEQDTTDFTLDLGSGNDEEIEEFADDSESEDYLLDF